MNLSDFCSFSPSCVHGKCTYISGKGNKCICDLGWKFEACDKCVPYCDCPNQGTDSCNLPNECKCKPGQFDPMGICSHFNLQIFNKNQTQFSTTIVLKHHPDMEQIASNAILTNPLDNQQNMGQFLFEKWNKNKEKHDRIVKGKKQKMASIMNNETTSFHQIMSKLLKKDKNNPVKFETILNVELTKSQIKNIVMDAKCSTLSETSESKTTYLLIF